MGRLEAMTRDDELAAMARTFRLGIGLPAPREGESWADVALRALRDGRGPVVARYVVRHLRPGKERLLDFGAGAAALQVRALLRLGYRVDGYDVPSSPADLESPSPAVRSRAKSYLDALEDEVLVDTLEDPYDVVLASNVLNVQTSLARLRETLGEIRGALRPGGVLVANLPEEPRGFLPRGRQGERKLETVLRDFFGDVVRVEEDLGEELELGDGRATAAVLWVCR